MIPKISVIVPCYGVEKYLDRCIVSLVNQTLKDLEIILVDDVSPDRVPEMCDEWSKKDSRIKVIHKEKNEGLGYARNTGLDAATGEYVAFVDSDDYVSVCMYETLLNAIDSTNTDAAICNYNRIYADRIVPICIDGIENNISVISAKSDYIPNVIGTLPESQHNQLYGYAVWNILFRREVIERNNIRFESERILCSEDIPFQLDYFSKVNNVVLVSNCLYCYCMNPGTLTTKYQADRFDREVVLFNNLHYRLLGYGFQIDSYELRIGKMLLYKALFSVCDTIKSLTFINAISALKHICDNPTLIDVLSSYPIRRMPFKKRIFYYFLKRKNAIAIVFFYKILHR